MIASEVAKSTGVSDANRVRFIRKAKWLGFTLKDVKTILGEADSGKSPCGEVRRIITDRTIRLPTGKTVSVKFSPNESGEFEFTCQMGMLRG